MVSARTIVLIGFGTALWVVLAFASAFTQPVPGFITVYLPLEVFGTFPVWFGIPGLVGNFIGGWLSDVPTKGFLFSPNGLVALISALPLYFMPKGVSDLKTGMSYAVWIPISVISNVLILYLALAAYALFGLLPSNLIPALFFVTLPWVIGQAVIVNTMLMKAMTPFLKRTGLYYGTFWEWREAVAGARSQGARPPQLL